MTAQLLVNPVRPYAWGSHTVLPELLGETRPSDQPWAEIWVGAHPGDPSRLPDGRTLDALEPQLPFLVKLLAAAQPLSVQAHPDLAQARAGFAAEQARGVPLDAPERSYKDANHKPELLVALHPVVALCGFRPVDEIARLVQRVGSPRLSRVAAAVLDADGSEGSEGSEGDRLQSLFLGLMRLRAAPDEAAALVDEVAVGCRRVVDEDDSGPDAEAAGWVRRLAHDYPADPGAALPLVLRLVDLAPGDGVFVPAGVLHAYLTGSGVEVQATSDNVLRGGLTPKHVDLDELAAVVRFAAHDDGLVRPRDVAPGLAAYDVPVDDFAVRRVRPATAPTGSVPVDDLAGPRLVVCVDGHVSVDGAEVGPGRAAYVPAGDPLSVTGPGTCFVVGRAAP